MGIKPAPRQAWISISTYTPEKNNGRVIVDFDDARTLDRLYDMDPDYLFQNSDFETQIDRVRKELAAIDKTWDSGHLRTRTSERLLGARKKRLEYVLQFGYSSLQKASHRSAVARTLRGTALSKTR